MSELRRLQNLFFPTALFCRWKSRSPERVRNSSGPHIVWQSAQAKSKEAPSSLPISFFSGRKSSHGSPCRLPLVSHLPELDHESLSWPITSGGSGCHGWLRPVMIPHQTSTGRRQDGLGKDFQVSNQHQLVKGKWQESWRFKDKGNRRCKVISLQLIKINGKKKQELVKHQNNNNNKWAHKKGGEQEEKHMQRCRGTGNDLTWVLGDHWCEKWSTSCHVSKQGCHNH